MKYFLIFVATLSFAPLFVLANGFVPDSIWLSDDSPKDGEVIDIFVTVFNASDATITGVIRYYDDKVLLGEVPVTIPQKGAKLVFLTWEANQGDRVIFARFSSGDAPLEETKKLRLRVKAPIIPSTVEDVSKDTFREEIEGDYSLDSTQEAEVAGEFGEFVDKAIVLTKETAMTVFGYTESARITSGEYLIESQDSTENKKAAIIDEGEGGSSSPFMYDLKRISMGAYIYILAAIIFIVTTKMLFYITLIALIFGIIYLIRRRREAYL